MKRCYLTCERIGGVCELAVRMGVMGVLSLAEEGEPAAATFVI